MKHMKILKNMLIAIFFTLSLSVGLFLHSKTALAQSGDNRAELCVLGPPSAETFPDLQMTFRAYDVNTFAVPQNLIGSQITVVDNGKQVIPSSLKSFHDVGINVVFIVDQGNRTDAAATRAVIQRFVDKYMVDGLDKVAIFTDLQNPDRKNPWLLLDTTSSRSEVLSVVAQMKDAPSSLYFPADNAFREAIGKISGANHDCKTPTIIIMIMGQDEISGANNVKDIINKSRLANVPAHVIHIEKFGFGGQEDYQKIANDTGGVYIQVPKSLPQEFTLLDQPLF